MRFRVLAYVGVVMLAFFIDMHFRSPNDNGVLYLSATAVPERTTFHNEELEEVTTTTTIPPTTTTTTIPPTTTTTQSPPTTSASVHISTASSSVWDRLAQCESGGNWSINTGNGYYGGIQFDYSTWLSYGGGQYAEYAHQATREQQIVVAERLRAERGYYPWPACARKLGLI